MQFTSLHLTASSPCDAHCQELWSVHFGLGVTILCHCLKLLFFSFNSTHVNAVLFSSTNRFM